jgi:predicted secreted protein
MMNYAPRRQLPIFVAIICSAVALMSIACSGPTLPEREIIITRGYYDFVRNPNYSGNVRLLAGGTLTVRLYSNGSTGALWSNPAQLSDPLVLEQTGHEYVPPLSPNAGAGGQEVWTFHASGKGNCTIYTEYKPSFETLPWWTFTLAVTVM